MGIRVVKSREDSEGHALVRTRGDDRWGVFRSMHMWLFVTVQIILRHSEAQGCREYVVKHVRYHMYTSAVFLFSAEGGGISGGGKIKEWRWFGRLGFASERRRRRRRTASKGCGGGLHQSKAAAAVW